MPPAHMRAPILFLFPTRGLHPGLPYITRTRAGSLVPWAHARLISGARGSGRYNNSGLSTSPLRGCADGRPYEHAACCRRLKVPRAKRPPRVTL